MPKLTTHKSTVVTENGEMKVHITLELNIKLDSDGLSVQAKPGLVETEAKSEKAPEKFVIPHFDNADKVDNVI